MYFYNSVLYQPPPWGLQPVFAINFSTTNRLFISLCYPLRDFRWRCHYSISIVGRPGFVLSQKFCARKNFKNFRTVLIRNHLFRQKDAQKPDTIYFFENLELILNEFIVSVRLPLSMKAALYKLNFYYINILTDTSLYFIFKLFAIKQC